MEATRFSPLLAPTRPFQEQGGGKPQTSIKKYCKIKWTLPAAEASLRLWQSQPCSSSAERGVQGLRSPALPFPSLPAKLSGTNGQEDIGCEGRGGSSQSLDPDIFGGFLLTQLQTSVKGTSCRWSGGRKRLCLGRARLPLLLLPSLGCFTSLADESCAASGGTAPHLDVAVSVKTSRVVRE